MGGGGGRGVGKMAVAIFFYWWLVMTILNYILNYMGCCCLTKFNSVGGWLDENRILLSGRHYFCCNKVNLNLYQPNPTLPNHALPHPTLPSATVLAGLHWQICLIYLDDLIVIGKKIEDMRIWVSYLKDYISNNKQIYCWSQDSVIYIVFAEELEHLVGKESRKKSSYKYICRQKQINFPMRGNGTFS